MRLVNQINVVADFEAFSACQMNLLTVKFSVGLFLVVEEVKSSMNDRNFIESCGWWIFFQKNHPTVKKSLAFSSENLIFIHLFSARKLKYSHMRFENYFLQRKIGCKDSDSSRCRGRSIFGSNTKNRRFLLFLFL